MRHRAFRMGGLICKKTGEDGAGTHRQRFEREWVVYVLLQDVPKSAGEDTIVVPLDVDRLPSLMLWQTSMTITCKLAIAAAAIGSF